MRKFSEVYPKLLLLGEYSILLGGNALTLPLRIFNAQFDFLIKANDTEAAIRSNRILKNFLKFIRGNELIINNINFTRLASDINNGLYVKSNIPTGYGLGSSGSVCAAILKSYSKIKLPAKISQIETFRIKSILASMESFFHGISSGIDPLACYFNCSILIKDTSIASLHNLCLPKTHMFLLDSDIQRNSQLLIETFTDDYKDQEYKMSFNKDYIPYVNSLIDTIIDFNYNKKYDHIKNRNNYYNLWEGLSILQFKFFNKMIPDNILPLWESGLNSGLYFLKLLGAGGGGYFLGFTNNKIKTETFLANNGYKLIWPEL